MKRNIIAILTVSAAKFAGEMTWAGNDPGGQGRGRSGRGAGVPANAHDIVSAIRVRKEWAVSCGYEWPHTGQKSE